MALDRSSGKEEIANARNQEIPGALDWSPEEGDCQPAERVILEDARFVSGLSDERIENGPVVAGYAEFGYFLHCDEDAQHHDWPEDLVAVMQNPREQGTEYCCSTATPIALRSSSAMTGSRHERSCPPTDPAVPRLLHLAQSRPRPGHLRRRGRSKGRRCGRPCRQNLCEGSRHRHRATGVISDLLRLRESWPADQSGKPTRQQLSSAKFHVKRQPTDRAQFDMTGARMVKPCASNFSVAFPDLRNFRNSAAAVFFEVAVRAAG